MRITKLSGIASSRRGPLCLASFPNFLLCVMIYFVISFIVDLYNDIKAISCPIAGCAGEGERE